MKRRSRRRYRRSRNSGVKVAGILGIIGAAVICGYLAARFVLAPFLGYNTEALKPELTAKIAEAISGEEAGEKDRAEKAYTLQFGVFSSEEGAKALANRLKNEGKEVRILPEGDTYKVVGPVYDTKEEAVKALKEAKKGSAPDVFVTVTE